MAFLLLLHQQTDILSQKNVAIDPATNIIDFYGTNFQTSTASWTAVGAISSVICSQDGLSFSILAGPVPNGAYSMSISSFYMISSTGTNTSRISYTLKNPITLTSGQTGVIAIPNVICPSSGTKVSISGNVQYSYSTLAGKVVTNATGTLAGTATHGPTLPAGIQYYSQITIPNSQSSATTSPFQQMINFTSSDPGFSSIATGNFGQNVEFFYSNGTVIPSWLENYTSNHALWWLKLGSIPAGSSQTLYMGFAPTSTNLFNTVNDGEAPQIPCGSTPTSSCSNYAEYDDGADVFYDYVNFNGTNLPTTYYVTSNGGSYSVDNGIYLSDYYVSSRFSFNASYAIYGTVKFSASGQVSDFNSRLGYVDQEDNFINLGGDSESYDEATVNYNGSAAYFYYFPPSYNIAEFLGLWTTHFATYALVGSTVYTNNKDFKFSNLPTYITVDALYVNATAEVYDLMIGGVPPNGVMPSISFGSVA